MSTGSVLRFGFDLSPLFKSYDQICAVAEDCASCHVPHGSANRRLLELPQPALCLQCHSLADTRHALGAAAGARVSGVSFRNCVSCHAAIHGSVTDEFLRF